MAETLQLTHAMGRTGWEVAHAGDDGAFALAAVGHCFAQRRRMLNLPLLWRLRRLWLGGMTALDPRVLRLAVCVDPRVRVSGARVEVRAELPDDGSGSARTRRGSASIPALQATLPLAALRGGDNGLPPVDGLAWRVHALSAEGARAFRKLAAAFVDLPRGAQITVRVGARDSRAPAELRAAFPLRIDLLLDPADGWLTLVPLRRLALG